MISKKLLSFALVFVMLISILPINIFAVDNEEKEERTVYLHAQGENPTETTNVSTVYMGDTAEIYLAVDDPNKGDYENGEHLEPQYDMNGYTVKIYFDPEYFAYASDASGPIDYTVPDNNIPSSGNEDEEVGDTPVEDVPQEIGYYVYRQGSGTQDVNGRTYNTAYITVFFSGEYLPQKSDDQLWYNLCKLPLTPLRTGDTDVFIDVDSADEFSLELFAKNTTDEYSQTFRFNTINGGYHHIIIDDKARPTPPVADPISGAYTSSQSVTLTAEDGCTIYYTIDGTDPKTSQTRIEYAGPIEIERTTEIRCYALRDSDGRESNTVSYNYRIIPNAPYLFDSARELIPNIYVENSPYTVYVSDKSEFGNIEDDSEVYYTFSESADSDNPVIGTDPETEWVRVEKSTQTIEIDRTRTVRLMTSKMGEFSDVAWYYLGIRPAGVVASHPSGQYDSKIDVTLTTETEGARIYYTLDGSDPITNGIEYVGTPIVIADDATLRAVAEYDDQWSYISSYWYLFSFYDDYGIEAFYPSGVYEGSVNVTLTPNDPGNTIIYSIDGGNTWLDYEGTLVIDADTDIIAKAVDENGVEGEEYTFTYRIKPLPPAFAPESTQFTNADSITIYCPESTNDTTERFELFYTTDGSDPITSPTAIKADDASDAATITITDYTVISAVVRKDGMAYSDVVTHSYDIVTVRPVRPLTTLLPGRYEREIGDEVGYSTQFMPIPSGTEIYYTIGYGDEFFPDPQPNTEGTFRYDGESIELKGKTTIKAVAVNEFGTKSDVGIFEYVITPEAPKAAPSSEISGDKLPVVPVEAVTGSTVHYTINGFENEFICDDGIFYIDTDTGNAYRDEACTEALGTENTGTISSPAQLELWAELDGISSDPNNYVYQLSDDPSALAAPYADKDTGTYDEINIDGNNNLLLINLYSLNSGDQIEYMLDGSGEWNVYDGGEIALKGDTIIQIRSARDENYSEVVSYVYNFIPLAPVITLPSGRYADTPVPTTRIELDGRAPTDKNYTIMYRANGDTMDYRYTGQEREIDHTMSFKAYVLNEDTGRVSPNTINYYIIEGAASSSGSVYIGYPYDADRISADVLGTGDYAEGIKLVSQNNNAEIHYYYTYTRTDGTTATTGELVYDNASPIMPSSNMEDITITAWLVDENGRIPNSDSVFYIDFIHLEVPVTSLEGSGETEFSRGTSYTIINDYPDDENIILYYTLDGSDPSDPQNTGRLVYAGEQLTLNGSTTVKTVYFSACGECTECMNDNQAGCLNGVYGRVGEYRYTVPTVEYVGGGGGAGGFGGSSGGSSGGETTEDNTRRYTVDIFGNEHPTHIGYINGYPDGSVQPDGAITREEMAAILYRIKNKEYEEPFASSGDVFPDVSSDRWSVTEIEYMTDQGVIYGYPDGEFKPEQNLTRAEFAALIYRFVGLTETDATNIFSDLNMDHWAYDEILALCDEGLVQGYEDGTFRAENDITRAEVMTVVNKILGRNPSEEYVKSLNFNPYNDLESDKWYYVIVLEATITHDYYLDDNDVEIEWENWK